MYYKCVKDEHIGIIIQQVLDQDLYNNPDQTEHLMLTKKKSSKFSSTRILIAQTMHKESSLVDLLLLYVIQT